MRSQPFTLIEAYLIHRLLAYHAPAVRAACYDNATPPGALLVPVFVGMLAAAAGSQRRRSALADLIELLRDPTMVWVYFMGLIVFFGAFLFPAITTRVRASGTESQRRALQRVTVGATVLLTATMFCNTRHLPISRDPALIRW
jgi:H+/Cl- antiporter ClcA